MTSAIKSVRISECKRRKLVKTTQPTPFLSHKVNISPPVSNVFYDMSFIDEPVPPNWDNQQVMLLFSIHLKVVALILFRLVKSK